MGTLTMLFDTCILVDYLSGHPDAAACIDNCPRPHISRITWIEIMVGSQPDEEEILLTFLHRFQLLELQPSHSTEAYRIRRDGISPGRRKPKLPDAILLATARTETMPFVTRNTRDFPEGTPGVEVPYVFTP